MTYILFKKSCTIGTLYYYSSSLVDRKNDSFSFFCLFFCFFLFGAKLRNTTLAASWHYKQNHTWKNSKSLQWSIVQNLHSDSSYADKCRDGLSVQARAKLKKKKKI